MRVGRIAEIVLDTYSNETYCGEIQSSSPATVFSFVPADNATGHYTKILQRVSVKIMFTEPLSNLRKLKAGLSAIVRIYTNDSKACQS